MFENKREDNREQRAMEFNRSIEDNANAFKALSADDATYMDIRDEKRDLTRWQQDLGDELEDLRHDLLREVQNSSGVWVTEREDVVDENGKMWSVEAEPMINKAGFYRIRTVIKRYLSRNMMMTNFDNEIIMKTLRRLHMLLTCFVGGNHEKYGIDKEDVQLIIRMVMDSVKGTLFRAYNNGERNYLNTINKRIDAFTTSGQPEVQKKGFMAAFGG